MCIFCCIVEEGGVQLRRYLRNWRMYLAMLTDPIIETLFRVVAWIIQICAVFGLPAILIWLSVKFLPRAAAVAVSLVVIAATLLCLDYVFENPAIEIPEEYMQYIDESDINRIRSLTKGIYSKNIPVIGVSAHVDYASEAMIDFTVRFWPYGSQTVSIGDGIFASNIYG